MHNCITNKNTKCHKITELHPCDVVKLIRWFFWFGFSKISLTIQYISCKSFSRLLVVYVTISLLLSSNDKIKKSHYFNCFFVSVFTNKIKITMDGSNTTSTLKLMPTAKDHDVELICLAFNPVLVVGNDSSIDINGTISSVETRRRLIVHCKIIIIFV
jgi:hypothetical protein